MIEDSVNYYEMMRIRKKAEYLNVISKPFIDMADKILSCSPYKIFINTNTGEIKRIYPFSTLRSLVIVRSWWKQATDINWER